MDSTTGAMLAKNSEKWNYFTGMLAALKSFHFSALWLAAHLQGCQNTF